MRTSCTIAVVCLAMGCSERAAAPAAAPEPAAPAVVEKPVAAQKPQKPREEPPANDKQFHARLLEIAGEYPGYGRVNKNLASDAAGCRDFQDREHYNGSYRDESWRLFLESAAFSPVLDPAEFSESMDLVAHGRKLYYLFVARPADYSFPDFKFYPTESRDLLKDVHDRLRAPVGQAIVKEAWVPEVVDREPANFAEPVARLQQTADGTKTIRTVEFTHAWHENKLYHAAEISSLFIMFKVDPATPDTDRGWVYGTVTTKRKQVTSAGRVETCMTCHKDAPFDRQFGPRGLGLQHGQPPMPLE